MNSDAPVFEYPPKEVPATDIFSFLGNQGPEAHIDNTGNQTTKASKSTSLSKLNVEAPVFVPGNAPKRAMPSREFSFSSSGPSFKPDAQVFKPGGTGLTLPPELPNASADKSDAKPIFGNIDFSEVIRPTKKSRAIPIVKPGSENGDTDGQEDESGRITQPEGRQKRMRRHEDDGDQVPLFASPKSTAIPAIPEPVSPISEVHEAKDEIALLQNATHSLKEIIDDMPASEVSSLSAEQDNSSAPFSFSDAQEAANFSTALPLVTPPARNANGEDLELPYATLYVKEDFPVEPVLSASSLPGNEELANRHARYLPQASGQSASPAQYRNHVHDLEGTGDGGESISPSSSASTSISSRHDSLAAHINQAVIGDRKDFEHELFAQDVAYIDSSYHEIDQVMKHLNDEDSDFGVERNPTAWTSQSPRRSPARGTLRSSASPKLLPSLHLRSDAPSPSPNRLNDAYQYLPPTESESPDTADVDMVARNARYSPSYRPSKDDVHRLNSPGSRSISDWDDAVSSVDQLQLQTKTVFFDNRVDNLIGSIVKQHIGPLESTLTGIQASLRTLSNASSSRRSQRAFSDEIEHSDADDEDDEDGASSTRVKSPHRDRRYEKLKASIQEIATAQQSLAPAVQLSEVFDAIKDLKSSVQQAPTSSNNMKNIVEEAVGRQLRGRSGPITSSHQSATAERSQLQIDGLESMLKIAETRAEDELKARRATEDALADSQRLLRGALQEAAEQRESAEETERSLAAFHEERHEGLRRTALLEGSQESLQKAAAELSEKNAALEDTLKEYRLSSTQWRAEIDDERSQNKDLNRTIDALRSEMDENIRARDLLRNQLSRLQDDMAQMSNDVTRDQNVRLSKEAELTCKLEALGSRLEAEARTRERLETEIVRLEVQEKEAMKARFMLEQAQQVSVDLEALVTKLRSEKHEHESNAARFERDLFEAREEGKAAVQRTRAVMEAEIKAANNEVNIVRDDLESTINRLQARLEDATIDADSVKVRHELVLEEASELRKRALQDAAEARDAALQEHYRFHESTVAELRTQHDRVLSNLSEDKQRTETHFNQRISLADEKVNHLTDKIAHLEEKLEVAKSAAHAAVQAAQSKKLTTAAPATTESWSKATGLPEKISPQALRESILVLQEQLQEREGRIENLEQKLSQVDRNAPAKVKEQESEITWLRELLGVRIDDLEDIIATLSQPVYNRETVKDAAIRLKANLQMEQQEKERAMAGGQSFPSLTSISNLAASPRALPMAAAAAWGNWRKARETPLNSLSAIANGSAEQTPSRASPPAQNFLSGLLTPPNTHMRQTPPTAKGMISRPSLSSRRPAGPYRTPRQSISVHDGSPPAEHQAPPITPPLLGKASYDQDAESTQFDEDIDQGGEAVEEPFGPNLGSILKTT